MRARAIRSAIATLLAGLGPLTLGPLAAPVSAAPSAFIRVNQVGYPATAAKRAYLMAKRDETGATFTVSPAGGGAAVFSGTVGAAAGSWSKRFKDVYALDFDQLQAPGRYVLSVAGRAAASSPAFTIAAGAGLYEGALANGLSFYEEQRDGPNFISSPLRSAAGHLNDAAASTYLTPTVNGEGEFKGELTNLGKTIDASGGWWDAGDYLKFVQTTSYGVDLQLIGVRDFPAEMGDTAAHSNFTAEARFGVEWLLRMWDDSSGTLYYQVGIGEGNSTTVGDHDIWRLPQADDTYGGSDESFRFIRHRPVFRAGPPGAPVSPNLAGRDAAAFALCFQVFSQTDPELAARCLRAGEHIYELANTNPQGHLLTAIPFDFYPESEWRDDLELGASELARALASGAQLPAGLAHTQSLYYLEQASHWAKAYITANGDDGGEPLNLYDVSALAHFELVQTMRNDGEPGGLEVSETQLIANLRAQLAGALEQSASDAFGFPFPWDSSDTASHGDGLSVMASEYQALTGETSYGADAARWLGNVLGANAWGSSFIIGDGTTFPDCPQHQVANLVGALDGSAPVLDGAVVEGPSEETSKGKLSGMRNCARKGASGFTRFNSKAVYEDNVQSFTTTEPAIDLTASSLLAFAWQGDPGAGSARSPR